MKLKLHDISADFPLSSWCQALGICRVSCNKTYLRRYFTIITWLLAITGEYGVIYRPQSMDNPKITFLYLQCAFISYLTEHVLMFWEFGLNRIIKYTIKIWLQSMNTWLWDWGSGSFFQVFLWRGKSCSTLLFQKALLGVNIFQLNYI